MSNLTTYHKKINKILEEYNFKLITDYKELKTNIDHIEYKCLCDNKIKKTLQQFFKKPEKNCCENRRQKIEFDKLPEEKEENGIVWKRYETIWISEEGKAFNMYGKEMTLDDKNRYYIDGKHYYASRILATVFKIENFDKLISQKFVVSFIDSDNNNLNIKNLKVISKSEINKKNGKKSKTSENFKKNMTKDITEYLLKIPYKIIEEFPEYIIFEDGSIYNNLNKSGAKRFISGSKSSEDYFNINRNDKTLKLHRLICLAFKPIEGKKIYDDYKDLQVNHIDGNKLNNHKDNLEWVEQSENINHAYENNLNKKVRAVIQFQNNNGEYGDIIKEFPSLAKASRETKIPEHEIREIAKGKIKHIFDKKFLWKYKNEDETESYRQKFSSKLADR